MRKTRNDAMNPMHDDRRETPLLSQLRAGMGLGPRHGMPVHDYMAACVRGYYEAGRVFGPAGDFVTAPEVSQVFGELIGLWCAVVWRQMGRPGALNLIELGPGRGTMMSDALRAMRLLPDCRAAVRVHLVETSAGLREAQAARLSGCGVPVSWAGQIADIDAAPSIVVGNEFVDALPVHQLVWSDGGWRTRCVALNDDGRLAFAAGHPFGAVAGDPPAPPLLERLAGSTREGDIVEFRRLGPQLCNLGRFVQAGLAVLLIDYGHLRGAIGDTLQAVRAHRFEDPLRSPGEADLTAHVDFEDLARVIGARGLAVDPPATQAAFLSALGIVERASRLMTSNPAQANAIEMAVGRLLSPSGMGDRFKVLAARSPHLPPLPGLTA